MLIRDSNFELEDFEIYLGNLYEDLDAKIRATFMFQKLSRSIEGLEALSCHGSALGALARVLREEGRKSFNLRLNIVSTFYMLSLFRNFHAFLSEQKIGKTTLNLLTLEIQCAELHLREGGAGKSGLGSFKETSSIPDFGGVLHNGQQERFLYIALSLLLNMAEDVSVEKRMMKCNLVETLCKLLSSKNVALLTITMTFLKKLSIFKENTDAMKECDIISRLSAVFSCQKESLLLGALRLLWNLSFDLSLRSDMVRCDIIPVLVSLVHKNKFEHLVYGLLYNISKDSIGLINADSEVVAILFQMILAKPMNLTTQELTALTINLTHVPVNSELLCKPRAVEQLLVQAINFQDPLLFKVIRNISQLESAKPQMLFALPALVKLLMNSETNLALQVEVMGTLTNLSSVAGSFDAILQQRKVLQFMAARLQAGILEDDAILEVIMFVGGICSQNTAPTISNAGLVARMCNVLEECIGDKDITTQCLYTLDNFLLYEPTRRDVLMLDKKVIGRIFRIYQVLVHTSQK